MNKFTLYTYNLSDQEKQQLKAELIKGNLVCVVPTTVNSDRAKRIKYQTEHYMKELGAHLVHEEILESNKFYGLVENQTPEIFVRLSDVQTILNESHWLGGTEIRAMLSKIAQFDSHGNTIKEEKP